LVLDWWFVLGVGVGGVVICCGGVGGCGFFVKDNIWSFFFFFFCLTHQMICRSQGPRGLRRTSAATRLLRSWVRIPPGA
jgi:hypothetical protein